MSNNEEEQKKSEIPVLTMEQLAYQRERWETAILRIYKKQAFFRNLISYMNLTEDLTSPYVAWVVREPQSTLGFNMGYNPAMLSEITDGKSVLGLVMHELLHIVFKHSERTLALLDWCKENDMPFVPDIKAAAVDLAVNSVLVTWSEQGTELNLDNKTWLHRISCHTEKKIDEAGMPVENPFYGLDPMQAYEYYFKKLTQDFKKRMQQGGGGQSSGGSGGTVAYDLSGKPGTGQFGDHSWMDKPDSNAPQSSDPSAPNYDPKAPPQTPGDEPTDIQKGMLDKAVKEGLDKDRKFGKFAGSGSLGEEFEMLYPLKELTQNWRELLKRSICSGKFLDKKNSMHKMNRRLLSLSDDEIPCKFPSKKHIRDFELIWIQDTSGSVSIQDRLDAAGVLLSLKSYKPNLVLRAIDWDDQFQREYVITTKEDVTKYAATSKGFGGTRFDTAIEYVMENYKPDTIIYSTDGYGESGNGRIVKNVNFIWLLTKGSQKPCEWGTFVHMHPEESK